MTDPKSGPAPDPRLSRRSLLQAGSAALLIGAAGSDPSRVARAEAPDDTQEGNDGQPEWRNKRDGMAYRRLGRTNMMISEVVSGGDPITLDNYKHMMEAIDRGLNYLDMAPAYNGGKTEEAFGKILAERKGLRDEVFLNTKVSDYNKARDRMYKEILEGLPESKQEAIRKRAAELRAERDALKPSYFLTYFPGQEDSLKGGYLRAAMQEEFGEKVEGSKELKKVIADSLDGSLKRVGTDHFDILMCPHGADAAEDLKSEYILETFKELKQKGKVRFLGLSSHNDPAGVLRAAAECGHYDMAMVAYNVVNGGYLDEPIRRAAAAGMGLIAMKSAMAVATHHEKLQPVPEWRVEKVQRIVPGDWKAPQKAYIWSLQNPHIAAVISNLWDRDYIRENLAVAGQKVELQPA